MKKCDPKAMTQYAMKMMNDIVSVFYYIYISIYLSISMEQMDEIYFLFCCLFLV